MDSAAGHQAHVKIGGADGDQAAPGQKHVALIQKSDAAPGGMAGYAEGSARKAIEFAAGKVAQRVAGKRVEREQDDIRGQDERADADAEVAVEVEGHDSVVPKKQNEHDRHIEKIAV